MTSALVNLGERWLFGAGSMYREPSGHITARTKRRRTRRLKSLGFQLKHALRMQQNDGNTNDIQSKTGYSAAVSAS